MTQDQLEKALAEYPVQHFRDRLTQVVAAAEARELVKAGERARRMAQGKRAAAASAARLRERAAAETRANVTRSGQVPRWDDVGR